MRITGGHDEGLKYFQRPVVLDAVPSIWSDWRTRPHAAEVLDLGSDQTCGFHAQERLLRLNVDLWNDPLHGISRDAFLVDKDCGFSRCGVAS